MIKTSLAVAAFLAQALPAMAYPLVDAACKDNVAACIKAGKLEYVSIYGELGYEDLDFFTMLDETLPEDAAFPRVFLNSYGGRVRAGRRTSGRAVDPLAGRNGQRMPRSDAAPRRSRNMVHSGGDGHVSFVWPYASGFARCIDRMALGLCADGRDSERRQSCGCSAKPGLDGGARADLRGDRPRAFQNVACSGLAARCDHRFFYGSDSIAWKCSALL
jgi:hypothetical protein